MTKIILNGYSGKMGQTIRRMCDGSSEFEVVAGIAKHLEAAAFPVFSSPAECGVAGDVIIDFSNASAVEPLLQFALDTKTSVVICTTGLSEEAGAAIISASKEIAVFRSANMSLGVNLLAQLVRKAADVLYNTDFDIEILEKHHNLKIDAPSGTALLLADAINAQLGGSLTYTYDRSSSRQRREHNELGIHAVRGGTIVGEHSVIFAGEDEVLEFTHIAQSKAVFAQGALKAAAFLKGKPAGLYDMTHVLAGII
ncbi:MAG: 4-hydroxy-tetrahydrodipicolinate reductase [Defluviitaleaceae bacterium]|nr:4-hydroxy-tetrahydrodipicolinate reductase [Defluviitaleaceae bacterium]